MTQESKEFLWDKRLAAATKRLLKRKPGLYLKIKEMIKLINDECVIEVQADEDMNVSITNKPAIYETLVYESDKDVSNDPGKTVISGSAKPEEFAAYADRTGSRAFSNYECQSCGARTRQFLGRCSSCGAWNSLVELSKPPTQEYTLNWTEETNEWLVECVLCALIELSGLDPDSRLNGRRIFLPESDHEEDEADIGFVYFVRNEDLCKIGITDNLLRRFKQIKPHEVLNVVRCRNRSELEDRLHKKFGAKQIPQSEYFRLDKNEIQEVHRLLLEWAEI